MSRRRALITGVTGQDGSYLSERLLADGLEVVGVVRSPDRASVASGVEIVRGDLHDVDELRALIREVAPDELYHLAAPTFVPASWDAPAETLSVIGGATAAVLLAARDCSARVVVPREPPELFGDAGVTPQTEDSPRRPWSPYGVAKLAAREELVRVMRERFDLHASAVITYNHESPRRPERFVTRKITRAAAAISLGKAEELVLGDLDAQRDWSHAADIVDGMVLAARHDVPGDYILASGVTRTVRDFVATAFDAAGLEVDDRVRSDPEFIRPAEPTVLCGDASRARDVLGWEPKVSFEALVREMVETDLALLR